MRKIGLSIAITFLTTTFCFSQDVITLKTGEDISAKIVEVGLTDIKYKKFDNIDGPSFTILKSDVLMTRYKNGTKDVYNLEKKSGKENSNNEDMALQGTKDAATYYKGQNSGKVWTGVTSVLTSPLLGLIPAVACSSAEPDQENLNFKDAELMKNTAYNVAYNEKAHKIKKNKIWKSYGIGSGIWLLLIILL
jgi:hypothetical protein